MGALKPERNAHVVERFAQGHRYPAVAREFGISVTRVRQICRKAVRLRLFGDKATYQRAPSQSERMRAILRGES